VKDDYYENRIGVSQYDCIIKLNNILSIIHMVFDDLELLLEMKIQAIITFYENWQKN
jgi:hypothetical protein